MFGGIRIGRLAGIPFFINPSWFFVFAFVTFSLATSSLPAWIPGEADWVYWLLGPTVAILFFGSLVAHELGHSLVSKAYGIPVRAITLHLFGGVAQLGREVRRPREEFWIAVAGPAVSVALGALFWGSGYLLGDFLPTVANSLVIVGILNVGVVVFNMVPGFPLDGGRVLRAAVWGAIGDYRRATKVASTAGRLVGLLLIFGGIYLAVTQGDISSLWLTIMGFFLMSIARQSYVQAVIQDTLQKTPLSEAQIRLIAVPGYLTLDELYAGYISTTGRQYYLVEVGERAVGVITPYALASVPRLLWGVTPLTSVMKPLESIPEISIASSAVAALNRMEDSGAEMLRTLEHGRTTGLVTRDQLLRLIMRARATR